MIKVKDFFELYGLDCPSWLAWEMLEREWLDCSHTIGDDGVHRWELKDLLRHVVLVYDGDSYVMQGFDSDGEQIMSRSISSDGLHVES